MSQEYLIKQLEEYQETIDPKRIEAAAKKRKGILRRGAAAFTQVSGVYIAVGAGLMLFGLLALSTPNLFTSTVEAAYLAYLKHAPIQIVGYFSEEKAVWLEDLRARGCALEYEARTRVQHELFGQTTTLLYPEYMRCVEATRRLDI